MWLANARWGILAVSLCLGSACSNPPPSVGTDDDDDDNNRPSVKLLEGSGAGGDITIHFIPKDEDLDKVSVTVQFSVDDGETFQFCTAQDRGPNPVKDIVSGTETEFIWDSAADSSGTVKVILRLVPNDGDQDGSAVLSDQFEITNEGGDDDDDDNGNPGLDEVGGYQDLDFHGGVATAELNGSSTTTRDNRNEEFLLVMANTDVSSIGYTIKRVELEEEEARQAAQGQKARRGKLRWSEQKRPVSAFREGVRDWAELNRYLPQPVAEREASWQPQEVGSTRQEFNVKASLEDNGDYETVLGVLAADGKKVNIFVDERVPIDWDYDCATAEIDEPDPYRDTYGFDSCDLSEVAQYFDDNIVEHLRDVFGDESDIDENEKITVLITPILNQLTLVSEEGDATKLVKVLVDPEVDLNPYDAKYNPGSNQQEIMYLYAPDPAGFFNPLTGGGGESAVEAYVTVDMAANIAIATENLISYNAHYFLNEGDAEEDWLNDGLGLLAADLTGFGSVVYDDVFYFLDAPYLSSMTEENTMDASDDRGQQYLMLRYLVDTEGESILELLMDTQQTGVDNIEAALQEARDDTEASFDDFYLDFLTAITVDGLVSSSTGSPLVPAVKGFAQATTIPSTSAEYVGAQGYQMGINIRGMNYARTRNPEDGSFTTKEFLLQGADWSHFAQGMNYQGFLTGGYSGQLTRIGGLIDSATVLKITASGDSAIGRIIRLEDIDPAEPSYVVEQVFGSLADDHIWMNVFEDGRESVALGEIVESMSMVLHSGSEASVADTDVFAFDLSTFSGKSARLAITLDRSIANESGEAGLKDVLLALVPLDDVPVPSDVSGNYQCDGKNVSVYYPGSYLDYLFTQYVLVPDITSTGLFDPAGKPSSDPAVCNFDYKWEEKEQLPLQNDSDEPLPTNLIDQILTYQTQQLGGASSIDGFYPYSTRWIDGESLDANDTAEYDFANGFGGRNVKVGEEANMMIEVPAGGAKHQYALVVGGPSSTGPYELTVRTVVQP